MTAGEAIAERAESFNTTYLRLFDAFIRLYDGQYPIMGNAQVMTAKVSWDNATYWAITALLFFQQRYRRPEFIASIDTLMRRFFVLHARMQAFFRAWNSGRRQGAYAHAAANVVDVEFLRRLQADLAHPHDGRRGAARATRCELRAARSIRANMAAQSPSEQHPSLARFVSDAEPRLRPPRPHALARLLRVFQRKLQVRLNAHFFWRVCETTNAAGRRSC